MDIHLDSRVVAGNFLDIRVDADNRLDTRVVEGKEQIVLDMLVVSLVIQDREVVAVDIVVLE